MAQGNMSGWMAQGNMSGWMSTGEHEWVDEHGAGGNMSGWIVMLGESCYTLINSHSLDPAGRV